MNKVKKYYTHIKVTYEHLCQFCDNTHKEEFGQGYHLALPIPGIPPGWVLVDGRLICDAHQIEFKVDGVSAL